MEWEGAKTCGCSLPRDWTANVSFEWLKLTVSYKSVCLGGARVESICLS